MARSTGSMAKEAIKRGEQTMVEVAKVNGKVH
ncbi:hypothetical protein B0H39_004290 [Clostridium beijerinckii]|nr:hypothetical protein [Clostridium beijerinckii]NOV70071.1 hypothetical protein [Clostridium beijerinckii]NOW31022.1 hypothetical protein [Clostridium beijerinckii]NOW86409.1 hypothetical protein [Clostridium beijerinckii]